MFLKCIYGSNLLLLFDVCASELRVRFLDEWFDWLPIYIINQSTWLFFIIWYISVLFFCMSSKLKALHCWNILLPFWFKGWPWCVYIYLHLENLYFFGLGVSPDSGLPTAYLLMVEKVKVAFFENQIYFLSFSLLRQPAADFNDPKNWRINPFGWFILQL